MRTQNAEYFKIHDVRDGLVRQGRLIHVLDKTTTTTRTSVPGSDDKVETEEEFGELHGHAELIELHGGKWTRKLVGAPPSPELAVVCRGSAARRHLLPDGDQTRRVVDVDRGRPPALDGERVQRDAGRGDEHVRRRRGVARRSGIRRSRSAARSAARCRTRTSASSPSR